MSLSSTHQFIVNTVITVFISHFPRFAFLTLLIFSRILSCLTIEGLMAFFMLPLGLFTTSRSQTEVGTDKGELDGGHRD